MRSVLVHLVLYTIMSAGCSDVCGVEAWGGGEFSLTLSGAISDVIEGPGLTSSELDDWVGGESPHWVDASGQYAQWGRTGALFGESLDDGGMAGFVMGWEVDQLEGCDGAAFLGLYVGTDHWARFEVSGADGIFLFDSVAADFTYEGGRAGRASWEARPATRGDWTCLPEDASVLVEVDWRMDKKVHTKRRDECSREWGEWDW